MVMSPHLVIEALNTTLNILGNILFARDFFLHDVLEVWKNCWFASLFPDSPLPVMNLVDSAAKHRALSH
jgi:hypothetical protein